MNNDELEPVRSAATAIAAVIINSFVVTHSIIITVIVTVAVLAVALSRAKRVRRRPGDRERFEAGFHGDAGPVAYRMDERTGGAMSFDRSEAAERWSQKKRLDRLYPRLGQTRGPTWRPS